MRKILCDCLLSTLSLLTHCCKVTIAKFDWPDSLGFMCRNLSQELSASSRPPTYKSNLILCLLTVAVLSSSLHLSLL